eukprot:560747-Amphidinium_carterae.1
MRFFGGLVWLRNRGRKYEVGEDELEDDVLRPQPSKVVAPTLHPGGTGCAIGSNRTSGFIMVATDFIA